MKKSISCIISNTDSNLTWSFVCLQDDQKVESAFDVKLKIRKGLPIDELTKAAGEVVKKIQEVGYTNIPVYIALNINKMFIDELILPPLSGKELAKAYELEIQKLLPLHEQKYIENNIAQSNEYKQIVITTLFCEKTFYVKCLYLLKAARLKIAAINILPIKLKNFALNNKLINPKEQCIIVDIEKRNTSLVFVNKGQVKAFDYIDCGTNQLYKAFSSKKFSVEGEEQNGTIAAETIENIFGVIVEAYAPILQGIKKLLGYYDLAEAKIYVHSRKDINSIIIGAFTHNLRHEVVALNVQNEFINENFEIYSVFSKDNSKVDLALPLRVK